MMALTGELVTGTSHLTEAVMMMLSLQIGLQSRWPPPRVRVWFLPTGESCSCHCSGMLCCFLLLIDVWFSALEIKVE